MQPNFDISSARILPIAGRVPLWKFDSDVSGIEKKAIMLQSELGGGNSSKTRAILAQLTILLGMLGGIGSASVHAKATIHAAIAKAQRCIAQQEEEENTRGNSVDVELKFSAAIYGFMSGRARKFYDSIDENMHYTVMPVDEDGDAIAYAVHKIDGKTLKRRMSIIKFHSLDTDNKKKVLYETFGAEEAEGEGTPKDKALLSKKRQQLFELHDALDDMEEYKAAEITHKYKPDMAAAMIEKNHKLIEGAHRQIDEVIHRYDALIANLNDDMAIAILKAAKLTMKKMLKENVIDHVLLEQPIEAPLISGGSGVADAVLSPAGQNGNSTRHFYPVYTN